MTEEGDMAVDQEQKANNDGQEQGTNEVYQLGPSAIDITPDKDGGVMKEIVKEGTGSDTPNTGDKVLVHYTGRLLDGTVFDSSRDREDKFEFPLGKGEVIKGWDLGVATMKKNEVAVLTCKPEYAYGKSGQPPKIPPDATLVFEIELFEWKMEDLSSKKDMGILRSIISTGDSFLTPNEDAVVNVHLVGRHQAVEFENRDVTFTLGEGSESGIVEGVETALYKFKKNEKSLIKLKPAYAYGAKGNTEFGIPPNAEVEYEITLKSFEKAKESWEMDKEEKLDQAEIIKSKGTNYFKVEKYKLAVKQYKKIISYLEFETGFPEENEKKKKELLLAAHLNLAMCYLKLDEYLDAIKECDDALKLDANNEKGFFRKGLAELAINEFELAKSCFQAVLAVDSSNKAAQKQIIICNNKLKQQLDKERRTYRNMFEKFAKQDSLISKEEKTEKWKTSDSGDNEDGEIMQVDETSSVNA